MALTLLLGLMMIGAASSETGVAEGAVPSQQNVSAAKDLRRCVCASSFLHCPCGIDCQKNMGKEHGFDLHQGCSCLSCNLRGATESKPAEGAKAEDLLTLLAEQEQDWDAASVPGDSQLTFCRCGSLGNSCRSCSPSSQSPLKWLNRDPPGHQREPERTSVLVPKILHVTLSDVS
eukprot:Skav224521  [mRNA]  locus=scaffold388:358035:362026:+ [translate_table: standard]